MGGIIDSLPNGGIGSGAPCVLCGRWNGHTRSCLNYVPTQLDVLEEAKGNAEAMTRLKEMLAEKPETKPSNPKDALGTNRVALDMVSAIAAAEESLAMAEGMLKYGKWNFRVVGVRASIYTGAALRHLMKWYQGGQDRDPKTGVHHLGSVRACAGILLDAEAKGILRDDRPPAIVNLDQLLDSMEARVKHLKELFKEHQPKHYTIVDTEQAA